MESEHIFLKVKTSIKIIDKEKDNIEIKNLLSNKYVNQLKLIDIKVVQNILKYEDLRSTLNWCRKNGLFVLNQGRSRTVNEIEFILSFYQPYIQNLKKKHKNWREKFINYIEGNFYQLLSSFDEKTEKNRPSNYKPKSTSTQTFLNDMKNI